MNITVRQATMEDFEVCNRLLYEVQELHVQNEPHIFREVPGKTIWSQNQFVGFLEDPNQVVFLAEGDRQAVGFAYVIVREAPPLTVYVPRRFAIVDSIGVTAGWRGCGVGRALMQQAEVWAKEHGAARLELSVHCFNQKAIEFYESVGLKAYTQRMDKPLD